MRVLAADSSEGRAFIERTKQRAVCDLTEVAPQVSAIIADVRERGDAALVHYAEQWDGLSSGQSVRVSEQDMAEALRTLPPNVREALTTAAENIRRFCRLQAPRPFTKDIAAGISLGQIVRPLDSVGCYVPGGRYPLPSTLLMTVIPAQIAGVPRVVVCSPRPAQETLAAAALLGMKDMYRVGGAQAIAALAFGTQSIGCVTKIVGPGNQYVAAAKKQISDAGIAAIDMLAGPTEALILSRTGNARFVAADMVAQAEHDPLASSIFVTTNSDLAGAVANELSRQCQGNEIARTSLARNGAVLLVNSWDEAIRLANEIASEHLTIDDETDLDRITAAGSIFIGDYSAQPLGDYVSGPNHVLPTAGTARFRGGLSVADFVKVISVQKVERRAYAQLASSGEVLAQVEGLSAHWRALQVRREEAASA